MKVIQAELVESQATGAAKSRWQGIAGVAQVAIVGTVTTATPTPATYKDSGRHHYNTTAVTNSTWQTIIASTAGASTKITIFDSSGQTLELGIGGVGVEARRLLIPPGGFNGMIDLTIPLGSRVSIRAVSVATISKGEMVINLLG